MQQSVPQQPAYPPTLPTLANPPLKYSKRAAAGLGITQMVIGVLCVIIMIVEISICTKHERCLATKSGYGIWCGVIFFASGILGFLSSRTTTSRGIINSFMVMSIISAIFTAILLIVSVFNALLTPLAYHASSLRVAMYVITSTSSLLAVLSIVEAVVGIVSAVLCCRAVCSRQQQAPNSEKYKELCRAIPTENINE